MGRVIFPSRLDESSMERAKPQLVHKGRISPAVLVEEQLEDQERRKREEVV